MPFPFKGIMFLYKFNVFSVPCEPSNLIKGSKYNFVLLKNFYVSQLSLFLCFRKFLFEDSSLRIILLRMLPFGVDRVGHTSKRCYRRHEQRLHQLSHALLALVEGVLASDLGCRVSLHLANIGRLSSLPSFSSSVEIGF